MAQNISLLNAQYNSVPAVLLPKTGGGTARFDDASVTTATASDVASGKIFLASDGTITTGTNSGGGGGASNLVTGTFTFSPSSASAHTVALDYSGSGFPIVCAIVLDDGVYNPTYTNTVARYSIAQFFMTKTYIDETPTYTASGSHENLGAVASVFKSSASTASTLSRANNASAVFFNASSATASTTNCVRFNNRKSMSVYVGAATGTSRYGFFNGLAYRYWIIYSE